MKKTTILLVIILILCSTPSNLFAASPWTKAQTYGGKTGGKLVFGLKNVLFGWSSLFMEPAEAIANGENIWAGFGQGLAYPIINTVGGALQFLTFPAPFDIPLPETGEKF
ncbi:MAG: hypothetical protein A3G33_01445 [Omnitrophica bacterium RIFCSPLOWO2_12_FULL_44_17]|uniref:Exosortase n=1 Tax=Candidatus Danuiimicrobium aquiferis TaxID=1801832 RepID=A0A1G1L1P2_9BACT|nr:MAG: hypothetical protein A3B72_00675 [Omnitrophica bacterium RIFCSPHIGHO2_02_FULL_45_28]OGW92105.1 MAG: hypothetical protein A3E74_01550 [Omnitrophica bacterium RIFCSPHIGHO2_12_FULL_44_12]OGW99067.1 MAG: hypothetical protein A3G33_01445 [Omnitrophica bacterium RIFCSPLOWO2_12_FULL_44_17]OGX04140.1 MAG: hypothetical protein A3J12_11095 [Omnitrophica bacterium RIFCSPLOWO2_02_FULL_44_11]